MNAISFISARKALASVLVLGTLSVAAPALAEDEGDITVEGSATFTTDYRFRGVSYSNLDPAVQAGISVSTAPGFFVGIWGSSIAETAGSTVEVDLTAGWAGAVAGLDVSAGVNGYFYPGGEDVNTYEFFGTVGVPLGPVSATLGANWSPNQSNLDRSSRYFFGALEAGLPDTPITLRASLGHEQGSFVYDDFGDTTKKWDWLVGADITWNALTLGVAYVGTDLSNAIYDDGFDRFKGNRMAKDGIVVSLTASF